MRVPWPFTEMSLLLLLALVGTTLPDVCSSDRKLRPLVGRSSTCLASRIDDSSLSRVRISGAEACTVTASCSVPTPIRKSISGFVLAWNSRPSRFCGAKPGNSTVSVHLPVGGSAVNV